MIFSKVRTEGNTDLDENLVNKLIHVMTCPSTWGGGGNHFPSDGWLDLPEATPHDKLEGVYLNV